MTDRDISVIAVLIMLGLIFFAMIGGSCSEVTTTLS